MAVSKQLLAQLILDEQVPRCFAFRPPVSRTHSLAQFGPEVARVGRQLFLGPQPLSSVKNGMVGQPEQLVSARAF